MTTILLVRHGEVAGNSGQSRSFAGARDLELTPRGVLQAEAIAHRLRGEKISHIYASTLQRAWKTAEKIATHHNLGVEKSSAWCEVNYGAWEGLSEAEIARDYGELWHQRVQDPWNIAPPDGESYAMLWERLGPAWKQLIARHEGETVCVVGHNGSLRVLLCRLLEAPPRHARRLQIGNCSLSQILVADQSAKTVDGGNLEGPPLVISYVNDTSHLRGLTMDSP